jgi:hypothetical protein
MNKSGLIISLDLEMRWGILESYTEFDSYKANILGVEDAVVEILNLFDKYRIHATWATVGALLCDCLEEFQQYSPKKKPNFNNDKFSSYAYHDEIKYEEEQFFNYKIINNILDANNQEFASHSFSHLFVQEGGVSKEDFDSDLKSFARVYSDKYDSKVNSFVFPRNQVNYLDILKKNSYKVFRGNKREWFYHANTKLSKLARFYNLHFGSVELGTTNAFYDEGIVNIPGTIFLRPYDNKIMSFIRVRRIKKVLKYANNNNKLVHLWWHPHNFGINIERNINMLAKVLDYANKIGIESFNMREMGQALKR